MTACWTFGRPTTTTSSLVPAGGGELPVLVKINGRAPESGPIAAADVRKIEAIGGTLSYIDLSEARQNDAAFANLKLTVESVPDDLWKIDYEPIGSVIDEIYADDLAARTAGLSWSEKVSRIDRWISQREATARQAPPVGQFDHFSAAPASRLAAPSGAAAESSGDDGGIVDIVEEVSQPESIDWMNFTVDHHPTPGSNAPFRFNGMEVAFSVQDGSATDPEDYQAPEDANGDPLDTLVWLDGEEGQNRSISVDIEQDNIWEEDEDFQVTLTGIENYDGDEGDATLGNSQATGVIENDDPIPVVSIEPSELVNEDEGPALLNVRLSNPSYQQITVNWTTEDETATSGNDYTSGGSTVTFPPESANEQQISVPIIDDTLDELNETFLVQLTGATNAQVSETDDEGRVTIVDNDGPLSGVIKSQRVAPVAIAEDLFTVKSGEYYEAGGGSQFRFEFDGTVAGGSTIRYQLWDTDGINELLATGQGTSFTYAFSEDANDSDLGDAYVSFYVDENNSGDWNFGEDYVNSPQFEVVPWASHSLTFEVSSLIPSSKIPNTIAGRTAWAQQLADSELPVVQIRQSEDDWRSPINLTMVPFNDAQFIVSPSRPDQAAQYDVDLHLDAGANVVFTFFLVWCRESLFQTIAAEGCSDSDASAVTYDADQYTFIHEVGHQYGSSHTPETETYEDYLMLPGGEGNVSGSREILRYGDAVNFYEGD